MLSRPSRRPVGISDRCLERVRIDCPRGNVRVRILPVSSRTTRMVRGRISVLPRSDAELPAAMPDSAPRYRLVIFDAIDNPQELREMICGATGMHPTDAVQWLARAPGVWSLPFDE